MASWPDRTRQTLGIYLGVWMGGQILGLLLIVAGAVSHSNLLVQVGVLLIAAGTAGSLMARLVALRALARVRWYNLVSLGLRVGAIIVLL